MKGIEVTEYAPVNHWRPPLSEPMRGYISREVAKAHEAGYERGFEEGSGGGLAVFLMGAMSGAFAFWLIARIFA
jgi:hypothetical protein